MENFGDRLSVDDIWRVVLFIKTIPNHTLDPNVVPEPKDYIIWQPSKELLAWLATQQKLTDNASFDKKAVTDPFMQEAMRVFPGLAPGDSFFINGTTETLSLDGGAQRDPTIYSDLLNRAWAEAKARGEKLPPSRRRRSRPRCRASNEAPAAPLALVALVALAAAGASRSRTTRPRATSRSG